MTDGICEICGEPMPRGQEMFRYHGYSGDCPKPPLQDLSCKPGESLTERLDREIADNAALLNLHASVLRERDNLRSEAQQWREAFERASSDYGVLRAEVEGLRKLVPQAFSEGVKSGMDEYRKFNGGKSWSQTKAFSAMAALRCGGEA